MQKKSVTRKGLTNAFQMALLSFGLLFFLFPLEDAGTGGYMTVVPMVCRLVLVAIVFPLCAGLCAYRTKKESCRIYEEVSPRFGRCLSAFTGGLIGPLGIIPLTAYLTVSTIIPLAGLRDGILIRIVLLVFLITLSHYATSSFKKNHMFPAIAVGAFIIGVVAIILCLLGKSNAGVSTGGSTTRIYLEGHIGILWALAPAFLLGQGSEEEKPIRKSLVEPAMRTFIFGAALTLIPIVAILLAAFQFPAGGVFTAAEWIAVAVNGGAMQIVAVILTLVLGISVMVACQTASNVWLDGAGITEFVKPTVCKWTFPVISLALALPVVGEYWLKIAEALLVATYPITAVLVVFYGVIAKTSEPRKQHSLKFAYVSVAVFSLVMLAYHLARNFGVDAALLRGLYESMLLSKGHLTWIVIAVLFFVMGDTTYRKKEEKTASRTQEAINANKE